MWRFWLLVFVIGVFGVDGDEVKSVSVMEGESFTLHSGVKEEQRRNGLVWLYGPHEITIAEFPESSYGNINNEKFGDRLKLESQIGSHLIISNTTMKDSGLYKLKYDYMKAILYKTFKVTVYARLSVPVITRNSSSSDKCVVLCSVLCSVLNVSDVSLSWYKGMSLLSSINVSDLNIRLSLPLEVEYQDTNTYTCEVKNPVTNQTQHLNINDVCGSCSGKLQCFSFTGAVIRLVLSAVVGVATVAIVIYDIRSRRAEQKQKDQTSHSVQETTP